MSTLQPAVSGAPEPLVQRERDARGVITLTLNRPQAFNALSEALLSALQEQLDALAQDESARVLVLFPKHCYHLGVLSDMSNTLGTPFTASELLTKVRRSLPHPGVA